jgi:hypothetical protein
VQTLGCHLAYHMPYFGYGFSHAYRLPGSPSSVVASAWLGADDPAWSHAEGPSSGSGSLVRSSLQPSSSLLVLVTHESVQVWNGGQNRYLMGSWDVPAGHRIRHAVVGELGDVGVVFSTDPEREGTVRMAGAEISGCTDEAQRSAPGLPYHVAVIGYVKKKALQSLSWAASMGRLMGDDGMLVEEVDVGEVWRETVTDAPSRSAMGPVGLVSKGGSMFWVVHADGRCAAYDWVHGSVIGDVRLVGGEVVGVGGCATRPGSGVDALVPLIVRDRGGKGRSPQTGVSIVSWKEVSAVLCEEGPREGGAKVPMGHVEVGGGTTAVTCVAVCPRELRVAIGLTSGEVVVRDFQTDRHGELASCTLSLEEWGHTAGDVGAVSALAWSPDGRVVAVGNARQGLSAWNTQGCRLFSAMVARGDSQMPLSPRLMIVGSGSRHGSAEYDEAAHGMPGVHTTDGVSGMDNKIDGHGLGKAETSEMDGGPYVAVSHLSFSSHGAHLIVQSDRYRQMFFEVSFARCLENHVILERHLTPASTSSTAFSFLIGSDRLLLITQRLTIEHVCVPQQYLDSAYPIRVASLNRTQDDVVVAGLHGLAVYSIPRAKWRLIGDLSQDKSLVVRHLGWVHSDVIVVCAEVKGTGRGNKPSAFGKRGVKLLFFPKGHLDASSLLGDHDLSPDLGIPIVMDVSNGRISLVFERGEVQVLRYECVIGRSGARDDRHPEQDRGNGTAGAAALGAPVVTSIHFELEYSFDIPMEDGDRVHLANTFRSLSVMKRGDGSLWCLILWDNGELGCIDLNEQSFRVLAREIDYYWIPETKGVGVQGKAPGRHVKTGSTISTSSSIVDETSTWWWTYGKNGISLWLEDRCETTAPDPELGFDLEVLPIGVSLEDLSIVGLQHRTHKRRGQCANPALSIDFAPIAERQPVLACLLRRLLLNNRLEEALQLADSYSQGPHFARSMEWLLYTALDAASHGHDARPRPQGSGNGSDRPASELSKTIELISNFSQFSQLVVSVARKVDASMWPLLFDAAGSPANLCESSIHNGELDHAAAYLLIIHDVLGATEASRLTIKTLKPALTMSKYRLCANLLLFLGDTASIEDANRLSDVGRSTAAPGDSSAGDGYVTWLWNWIAPEPIDPSTSPFSSKNIHGSHGADSSRADSSRADSNPTDSTTLSARLHAAVSSGHPVPATSNITPMVEVWKLLAKHAWHILEDGNVRELASMAEAMAGVHGGLAALLQTTRHLNACSLSHITPSASLIANALFISGNEMTSASETELEEIPELMQSLLAAGCINYGLALAIVSSNADVMREFAEQNRDTWDRLIALISNDVHLCSFASVLMAAGDVAGSLHRSFTL